MNYILRWMEEDGISFARPRTPPQKVYIRFGKWGRRHRSYNFHTYEIEKGLSVYPARLTSEGYAELTDDEMILTAEDCAERLNGRCAFVLTGKEVGRGSDGEPVLVGIKLLPYAVMIDSIPKEIREVSE
jgi:hypothetical protein